MGAGDLTAEIAALLAAGESRSGDVALEPCSAGGNNRVFRVTGAGSPLIAKWYFTHASDTRDRLEAEYAFLAYASLRLGLDCVPRPVARDPAARLALYELIEGRKLGAAEIGEREVAAALAFVKALNGPGRAALAAGLPDASEACFSLRDHFAMVERRIARLDGIPDAEPIDRDARGFAREMSERWPGIAARIEASLGTLGIAPDTALPPGDRCVSPSDFGFHNAIAAPDGRLVFIDFEYAGWDDPAKLVNDFFCQPAVPVADHHYDAFVAGAMAYSPDASRLAARARIMRPIFAVKWCCIILNDFLPAAAERRRFADPAFDARARKAVQLALARQRFLAI